MVASALAVTIGFFEIRIARGTLWAGLLPTISSHGTAIAKLAGRAADGRSTTMKQTMVLVALGVLLTPCTLFVSDCIARSSYGQDVDRFDRDSDARSADSLLGPTVDVRSGLGSGQIPSCR